MAQTTISWKRFFKALIIYHLLLFFFFSPFILGAFPQTASLVPASVWMIDKSTQGLAVFSLIISTAMIYFWITHAYKWLTSGPTVALTPTPTELESGTAPAPNLIDLEVETSASGAPPAPPGSTAPHPVVLAFTFCAFATSSAIYPLTHDVVSLEKPLLENIASTLMFILGGLEVIAVAFLLLGFIWLFKRRAPASIAAMPAAAAMVASDEVEAAAPLSKEEKEVENA